MRRNFRMQPDIAVFGGALLLLLSLADMRCLAANAGPVTSNQPRLAVGPVFFTAPVSPIANLLSGESEQGQARQPEKLQPARLAAAAIDNGDLGSQQFEEYYVDWSAWMSDVADRWQRVLGFFQAPESSDGHNSASNRPAFIQFTCHRDGHVDHVTVLQGSGIAELDRQQVNALVDCMPLPPFPAGSRRQSVTLLYVWESAQNQAGNQGAQPRAVGKESPLETVSRPKETM